MAVQALPGPVIGHVRRARHVKGLAGSLTDARDEVAAGGAAAGDRQDRRQACRQNVEQASAVRALSGASTPRPLMRSIVSPKMSE